MAIVATIIAGTVAFGLVGARRVGITPEQFIVGGRSFGALLLWLLLAGEIYTSFTFLGAAGWAYGKGAPAFYILCYGTIAYAISYFLAPQIWKAAKDRGMLTAGDFFAVRYASKALGALVAVVGFVFLIPYVTLQLSGLQILLTIAGYGTFDARVAVAAAFIVITLFVFVSGLRGTAWSSIVKDVLVLGAVVFAGLVLPARFFHSPAHVIAAVLDQRPGWFTLSGGSAPYGVVWFVSTVALTALGFYMWPQSFAAVFSAKSDDAIRRNAIFLPLYQIMLLLVYFAGFTALLVVPGLKGQQADQSFMLVVQRYYSPWVLGAVAGAGCLAALVPVTGQLLAAASLVTKNVLKDFFGARGPGAMQTAQTRLLVLLVAALALGFWLYRPPTLVELLLLGYNGVTQFFPGAVFAFVWPRATAWGVGSGIVAGIATLVLAAAIKLDTVYGVNVGLAALAINTVVCVVVSSLTPRRAAAAGASTGG
jgi:solute:Na+ symporter, SSS family